MADRDLLCKAITQKQRSYAYHKRMKKPRDPATLKTNTLRVRLSDLELEKLESYAKSRDCTISQIIHEYIRRLPNPDK